VWSRDISRRSVSASGHAPVGNSLRFPDLCGPYRISTQTSRRVYEHELTLQNAQIDRKGIKECLYYSMIPVVRCIRQRNASMPACRAIVNGDTLVIDAWVCEDSICLTKRII
jgi:hypothetical protein